MTTENPRNEALRATLRQLGQRLAFYVTGDWDHDRIAEELGAAIFDALDDDFGHVARQLDTLHTLRVLHDALGREVAEQARHTKDRGASWEQVGKALGVTKQAAHLRFGK